MVFGVVGPHHLPVGSDADDKEPETEAPEPEAGEVGEEFEIERCIGVSFKPVWEHLWNHSIA